MSAVIGFYYFGPQQPLSSLSVLANYHWSVCVPLPIAKQKKTILFVCLPWHPSLLWFGFLLSLYPSWHAPSDSNSALLLLGGMSSQQDTSLKTAQVETSKQIFPLSPPPNHALLPLTHDLTVSCIGQVQASKIWALHVPLFYVCPKSVCCSCVCHGWPAQSAIRFLPFSGSPFLYGLPYPRIGPCLMVGFAFLQPTLFPATISCHTILLFLLRSSLPQSCQASSGLPFILLPIAQYRHWFFYYITSGLLCPICFPLGVLGSFAFLGLPQPFS